MKSFISGFVIFLLGFSTASAQFPYSIDLMLGVEYSYRDLKVTEDADRLDPDILAMNLALRDGETSKRNIRFGININKFLDDRFYFKTGFRYASVGYNGEKQTDIRWPSETDSNGNYTPDPNLYHENQFIYNYRYLVIPGIFRYHITEGRLAPFIETGLSLHIYAHTKRKTINEFETRTERYNDGEANADLTSVGSISLGFEYLLDHSHALFVQGIGRYHFSPRRRNATVQERLYNYGLEFGIRKRMGKHRITRV